MECRANVINVFMSMSGTGRSATAGGYRGTPDERQLYFPPDDQIRTWMRCMAWHGNGIALIFNRLGTHWFDELVMPHCTGLLFLTGRVDFIPGEEGGRTKGAPHQSILIAYDPLGECRNYMALKTCRLPGHFWDRRATNKKRSRLIAKKTEGSKN